MSEYINRDSLLERLREDLSKIEIAEFEATKEDDYITETGAKALHKAYSRVLENVLQEPVVWNVEKPEKTHMGGWLLLYGSYDNTPSELVFCCSECKHRIMVYGQDKPWENYCPACGADMRGTKPDD